MDVYEAVRETFVLLEVVVSRALEPLGLRVEQYNVLRLLRRAGELRMSAIAQRTLTDDSTATRTVESLVGRGLAERRRGEHDARVRLVAITGEGRRLADAADRARERAVSASLETMDGETINRMTTALDAARASLREGVRHG